MSPVVGSRPWTSDEDEFLRAFALSGTSAAAIATLMKRSEQAVRNRAVRLNIVLAKSRLFRRTGLKAKK
jgi:hypothetical protein